MLETVVKADVCVMRGERGVNLGYFMDHLIARLVFGLDLVYNASCGGNIINLRASFVGNGN